MCVVVVVCVFSDVSVCKDCFPAVTCMSLVCDAPCSKLTDAEFGQLLASAKKLTKSKARFDRLEVDADTARKVFAANP
ncbi:MAG: hypothetical protein P4L40_23165 [Terracidiphilus sp.]|nr:hypothetical protein [Terracidiphilus sp.]